MTGNRSLMVIAAVATVVLMTTASAAMLLRADRAHQYDTTASGATATSLPTGIVECDPSPCRLLSSSTAGNSTVGNTVVQLFASASGTANPDQGLGGRLRFEAPTGTSIFQIDISAANVLLTPSSLNCVSGPTPTCIVFGEYSQNSQHGGAIGEVYEQRNGYWSPASYNFFYSSAGFFALSEAKSGGQLQVITVQNDCGPIGELAVKSTRCARPNVYVQLFSISNASLGCTRSATAISLLPGRATSVPPAYDLHTCSAGSAG